MIRFLLSRALRAVTLVALVVVLNFLLVHSAPGDQVETIAGSMGGMSESAMAALRQQYGLDKPLLTQLGLYLAQMLSGDLGYSYYFNLPVADLIAQRVPATLLLVVSSVLCAMLLGTALGVLSARRPNGLLSQAVTLVSLVGFAAPVFWTGIMLIILFAATWPIFPVGGMRAVDAVQGGWRVLPVVTLVGLQFGNVLAGAILVETVFNWPGLGRLASDAVLRRDYPTILGTLLFSSLVVVVMNQLTDLCYRLVDPRIKT